MAIIGRFRPLWAVVTNLERRVETADNSPRHTRPGGEVEAARAAASMYGKTES